MTIKELYERALKYNSEDYELMVVNTLYLGTPAVPVTEGVIDIDHEGKQVVIRS